MKQRFLVVILVSACLCMAAKNDKAPNVKELGRTVIVVHDQSTMVTNSNILALYKR